MGWICADRSHSRKTILPDTEGYLPARKACPFSDWLTHRSNLAPAPTPLSGILWKKIRRTSIKALVVYDSQFGNTKKIAESVAKGLSSAGECSAVFIESIQQEDLAGLTFLAVGSPTQGFSATAEIKQWLDSLPANSLVGVLAAAFDTRFTQQKIAEVGILSILVSIFGYGAKPIARRLVKKGANLSAEPVGFYVADTEGPLLDQEMERAVDWARQLALTHYQLVKNTR
jgi:flavodoxin